MRCRLFFGVLVVGVMSCILLVVINVVERFDWWVWWDVVDG